MPATHHHHYNHTVNSMLAISQLLMARTLKVGSWEYIEQIPTLTVTFVKATFVLETLVHIMNITAVTDLMLTKL